MKFSKKQVSLLNIPIGDNEKQSPKKLPNLSDDDNNETFEIISNKDEKISSSSSEESVFNSETKIEESWEIPEAVACTFNSETHEIAVSHSENKKTK